MKPTKKTINLALQGGGSHGAFAWGVIDRLLEDERLVVEGIVGTSAGAINAAVTAYGLTVGGNKGARNALRQFWQKVSTAATFSPVQPSWLDRLMSQGGMDFSPGWLASDWMTRVLSP
jgi:NTE family protein